MFSIDVLRSGLPVITAPAEGTESVTVHVFVGAGSRYEQGNERGISHFLTFPLLTSESSCKALGFLCALGQHSVPSLKWCG